MFGCYSCCPTQTPGAEVAVNGCAPDAVLRMGGEAEANKKQEEEIIFHGNCCCTL
jgi:hypothetical protein